MEEQVSTPETEAVVVTTPAVPDSTSGIDDLRAAFADAPSEAVAPAASTDAPSTDEPAAEGEPPTAPEAGSISDEDISRVFKDPKVVQALQEAQGRSMAQARQLWEMELQRVREEEEALLLDDEEVGRRTREQQRMAPVLNQARAEGYARAQQEFVMHGIGDLWQKVPELRDLDADTKRQYDPTLPTWKSMGEYMNAIVDVAAAKRSEKLADKKAKELAKAMTASELNKFRQGQPSPAGVPGHGREVGKIIDVDNMTGKDILRSAFGN